MMNVYVATDTILRDTLPENEPTDLIEEIVLNPQPDLKVLSVEADQEIAEGKMMQYRDWKRVDGEDQTRPGGRAGRNVAVFGNQDTKQNSVMGLSDYFNLPGYYISIRLVLYV